VAKLVSEAWKNLSPTERAVYDEMSRLDKERYEIEKKNYTGPWKVLKQRKWSKDPDAPRRPMSAFLMFSNGKRAAVKKQNPSLSNADISRLLADRWRSAPAEERQTCIKQEFDERQEYKVKLAKWRVEQANLSLEQAAEFPVVAPQLASNQPSYFSAMGVTSLNPGGLPYTGTSSWVQAGDDRTVPLPMPQAAYSANFGGADSNALSYVNTATSAYYKQAYPFGMYSKFLVKSLTCYPSIARTNPSLSLYRY
jgi:high mobility group protein B1